MANIYSGLTELIGNTPLLELKKYRKQHGLKARIAAKLEMFNPGGSVKDRAALSMLEQAEESGRLKAGSVIIEPTSGNMGIGIACAALAKGYKSIIVMPDSMSRERRSIIKAFGAELILTEGKKGMNGAVQRASELLEEIPNSVMLQQFSNPANPLAHRLTTGPEIYRDTDGLVDIFVAGVGSGGTISGVGEYLKRMNKNIRIVAVEPEDSPVLSRATAGAHKIQGIGAGFVPEALNTNIYDEIITVGNDAAFNTGRELARCEGVLAGISSGAALWAAAKLAMRDENAGKLIVTLFPDTGDRYLSTEMFADD